MEQDFKDLSFGDTKMDGLVKHAPVKWKDGKDLTLMDFVMSFAVISSCANKEAVSCCIWAVGTLASVHLASVTEFSSEDLREPIQDGDGVIYNRNS